MPTWEAPGKSPALFPAAYATVTLEANRHRGQPFPLPYFHLTRDEAKARMADFRYWRFCLRQHGYGPGYDVEIGARVMTTLQRVGDLWRVNVTVRPLISDILAAAL